MTSIRSVGEVGLQRNQSVEEYKDIIGSMLEEVARLTSMIDTLFTISQADAGAIQLHRTVFPIMEVVEESVGLVGVLAEEKKQSIVVTGDGGLLVSADRGFLRMAVMNLLDNAVKYSAASTSIQVQLELLNGKGPESRQLNLVIKDEGPGIPPAEADRVFDRFYRLDESRARETGGAGLGLAIAKWSIEAHGGAILLDSSPGKGSAFNIRLPAA
jgi:signal transduction histidine kinase